MVLNELRSLFELLALAMILQVAFLLCTVVCFV